MYCAILRFCCASLACLADSRGVFDRPPAGKKDVTEEQRWTAVANQVLAELKTSKEPSLVRPPQYMTCKTEVERRVKAEIEAGPAAVDGGGGDGHETAPPTGGGVELRSTTNTLSPHAQVALTSLVAAYRRKTDAASL